MNADVDFLDQIAQAQPQPKVAPTLGPGQTFRDEIAKRESQGLPNDGYGASSPQLGRYQMTKDALIDAGMKDAKGNWTGKYNVHSDADFLQNRTAQDLALADFMKKVDGYLKGNGAFSRIGRQVDGDLGKFTITEGGILAAAHREGHKKTKEYLDWQESNNWKSDFNNLPADVQKKFRPIEKRLREFENVPYR